MLVVALKPGHDGAIAALDDDRLLFSIESEKDSFPRHAEVTPSSIFAALERLGDMPDVIAMGGWFKNRMLGSSSLGSGYHGFDLQNRTMTMLGKEVTFFSSSHERGHIALSMALAPQPAPLTAVLCWEGNLGHFYLVDDRWNVTERFPVMRGPGGRYAFVFGLADPRFPAVNSIPRLEDAGKLMALAAFADPQSVEPAVAETVDQILSAPFLQPKRTYQDSPLFNAGVQSEATKSAAALITERIFEKFADVAVKHLPRDIPLVISGGCGLNCDWNHRWRELGHFSSVFVPPCTDDSGSALGTAIDARFNVTGKPSPIEWNVYSGLEFEHDTEPDPAVWQRRGLDHAELAGAILAGRVVAWVQGRWEIGPRALGNRSLLAEPFNADTKHKLNQIKQREDYRPIAPCCRLEDAGKVFNEDFEDRYMLYFRTVRPDALPAVTHVDGSARAQTVTQESNAPLYELLSAVAARAGVGALCNTSLNFRGQGFINRMSDLAHYCESRSITDFVVGDQWFTRADPAP